MVGRFFVVGEVNGVDHVKVMHHFEKIGVEVGLAASQLQS